MCQSKGGRLIEQRFASSLSRSSHFLRCVSRDLLLDSVAIKNPSEDS